MKKLVSTGLSLAMAMSTFNVPTFATPPIDTKEKCMHLDDMIKDGYWTNKGNEVVCDCRTCKVILADYDHLDKIVSPENAHILSNEVLNKINLFIDRERWKNNNYIQISYDLNGGNYVGFRKNENIVLNKNCSQNVMNLRKSVQDILDGKASPEIASVINDLKTTCPKIIKNAETSKLITSSILIPTLIGTFFT